MNQKEQQVLKAPVLVSDSSNEVSGMTDPTREAFEAWISAPPFEAWIDAPSPSPPPLEQSVSRLTASSAWPGSYRDIATDLAWQAWQAALSARAQGEASTLHDRIEFALRDAGLSESEAARITAIATAPAARADTAMVLEHEGREFVVSSWIGPQLAELLAKDSTPATPKQQAVDEAMVERLRDHLVELRCYYVESRDGVRGYSAREAQYTRLIDEVDADLVALPGKTEVE